MSYLISLFHSHTANTTTLIVSSSFLVGALWHFFAIMMSVNVLVFLSHMVSGITSNPNLPESASGMVIDRFYSSEADWEGEMLNIKFGVCIFYSVFAHFIHININRSTREHIKNNICAILNSYNKDVWQHFQDKMCQKCGCIIGVKGMHVSAFDGFSQTSFLIEFGHS